MKSSVFRFANSQFIENKMDFHVIRLSIQQQQRTEISLAVIFSDEEKLFCCQSNEANAVQNVWTSVKHVQTSFQFFAMQQF